MWIDTNVNGERRMYNNHGQKALVIERFSNDSSSWALRLGGGGFWGNILGVFTTFEAAVAEYENICTAISDGLHYYKIQPEEVNDVAG